MSQRISRIYRDGLEIMLLDYSNLRGEEYIKAIKETEQYMLRLPKDHFTHGTISDSTNCKMDDSIRAALKDLDQSLKKHFGENYLDESRKKGAVTVSIGLTGIQKVIAGFLIRHTKFMDTREEAIQYILAQHRVMA